ncbi:MAG: sulfur relay protein DsrC [Gammaproteobacteria bacterium]|nr:sulfur relay protein DsrC [Gammaproteobacteria bacterium]
MLWLSEVMLERHDLESFEDLKKELAKRAKQGELFFQMDVKPPYSDTPKDWQDKLEAAFTARQE